MYNGAFRDVYFFEKTPKNLKLNLVVVVVLKLKSKGV